MRRLFGQPLSVFLPGMALRLTSLIVVEAFCFFSKLLEGIGQRDPMIHTDMTQVFEDGLG